MAVVTTQLPQALPEDAILLHLGFHKTGTTALQSAFAASRPELLAHGVLYPGKRRSHHPAAMAMTNRTWGVGREGGWDPDPKAWDRLARAARNHPGRVVVSSESFALTGDDAAARMVADLGPDRVHVVFTLRPVAELLASSWQQYLKSGWTVSYEDWLHQIVAELAPGARRSGFWLRNDYPTIVGRWASLVGPQRVHLVCLDGADRSFLTRSFEELLAIPEGMLGSAAVDSNRSLTAAEAELVRALNAASEDWDWPSFQRIVRTGAISALVEERHPRPHESGILTPQWALDAAAGHGRRCSQELDRLAVAVHGPLSVLGRPVVGVGDEDAVAPTHVPIDAALAAVLGAVHGTQRLAAEHQAAAGPRIPLRGRRAGGARDSRGRVGRARRFAHLSGAGLRPADLGTAHASQARGSLTRDPTVHVVRGSDRGRDNAAGQTTIPGGVRFWSMPCARTLASASCPVPVPAPPGVPQRDPLRERHQALSDAGASCVGGHHAGDHQG